MFFQALPYLLRRFIRGEILKYNPPQRRILNRPVPGNHVGSIQSSVLLHSDADRDSGHDPSRRGVRSERCIHISGVVPCRTGCRGEFPRRQHLFGLIGLTPGKQ